MSVMPPEHRRCRTLIVEDHVGIGVAMKLWVEREGHEADWAGTLAEGLATLTRRRPDCVLLDLTLPDGNGLDLLRRVRTERLPVRVAVTIAESDPATLEAVNGLAPEAFFAKPVDFSRLRAWLASGVAVTPAASR